MELTIENLRTLSCSGQIFLTAHSQARLYECGIRLADIRQAIQSGKSSNIARTTTGVHPVWYLASIWRAVGSMWCAASMRMRCGY